MQQYKPSSVKFLILGVAIITIYFNTKVADPFNTMKLIILLIVSGWLLGHLISSYRDHPVKAKTADLSPIVLCVAFIITLTISTFFTDPFIVGLIGDTQRRNGLLQYFGVTIIFLYASRVIDHLSALVIYKVAIFLGLILSTYGLIQLAGRDFVKWNNPYNAMISTLGNPNFASSMLAILTSIAIFSLTIQKFPKLYKILAIFVIFNSCTAIILSESRQGILVVFFSIIFFVSHYFYLNKKKIGITAICISIILSALAIMGMLQKGPLVSLLYKDSVSVRGYYWRAGVEMLKDKPFTGIGVDRYGEYFKQFREAGYPLKYGFDINSSNAHNIVIQMFATGGVLVGLTYLLILVYVFRMGLRAAKHADRDQQKVIIGLLSAWIGFQAQSLISIDSIGLSVWGWLLGGSIVALANRVNTNSQSLGNKNQIVNNKSLAQINLFQPIVSTLIMAPILFVTINLYRVESNVFNVNNFAISKIPENKQIVLNYANKVFNNKFADPFLKLQAANSIYIMGYKNEASIVVKKLLQEDPRNLDYLGVIAFLEESDGKIGEAIVTRTKLAKYDPWNAQNYLDLGKLYKLSGDLTKAEEMRDKILSFAPNTEIAENALEILA
jgi:O-antigen ligase